MSNYIEKELGGQKRGLKFNLNTLKFIGQLTGEDPFKFSFNVSEFNSLMSGVCIIVNAALLANDKQFTGTTEQVSDWVGELSIGTLAEIANVYTKALSITAAGESGTDTQQQPAAANV